MKTILIIEDSESIRENITEKLELTNYNVKTAANGKSGVSLAIEYKPDLIICDIMMPELDGYGVLNIVQRNPELGNVPFIFLTVKAEHGDFRKGMGLGADDYITKPFSPTDLLNSVESLLRKADKIKSATTDIKAPEQVADTRMQTRPYNHLYWKDKLINKKRSS